MITNKNCWNSCDDMYIEWQSIKKTYADIYLNFLLSTFYLHLYTHPESNTISLWGWIFLSTRTQFHGFFSYYIHGMNFDVLVSVITSYPWLDVCNYYLSILRSWNYVLWYDDVLLIQSALNSLRTICWLVNLNMFYHLFTDRSECTKNSVLCKFVMNN